MDRETAAYAKLIGSLHRDAILEAGTPEAMSAPCDGKRFASLDRLSYLENSLRGVAVCRCPICGVELGAFGPGTVGGLRAGVCPTASHPLHPSIACDWAGTFVLRAGVVLARGACCHDSGNPGDDCALCGPDAPEPLRG